MRRGLVIAVALAAVAVVPVAYALLTETAVRATRLQETTPAAAYAPSGASLFAWSQTSRAYPRRYNAFFKRGTRSPIKLNTVGRGYLGGIDPPFVVYQQIYRGRSNIKLYNYSSRVRSNPSGVNTPDWEWEPSMSNRRILFARDDLQSPTQWIILRDLTTGTEVVLETATLSSIEVFPGQVNGDFATWTLCELTCDVKRYQISTGTTTTLTKPAGAVHQYGGGPTSSGTVYLVRSGDGCGVAVHVVRYGPSDPAEGTIVASLPGARDVYSIYVRERAGANELFYERIRCPSNNWDIYKLVDPVP